MTRYLSSAARAFVSLLPQCVSRLLRQRWHEYLARTGRLLSDEPEFELLSQWIDPGDVVLDVGANIGAYTLRMAKLVGRSGRVLAFEPIPQTFRTLVRTAATCGLDNVVLLNLACSDKTAVVWMSIEETKGELEDIYQAHISDDPKGASSAHQALAVRVDGFAFPDRVRLVKIDAEGHDSAVLRGMMKLIAQSQPRLIVESPDDAAVAQLEQLGYRPQRLPRSPNTVFHPPL